MMISKLADYIRPSMNTSGKRNAPVTRITPHVVVGEFGALTVASWFNNPDREASANYIIGKDGEVVCNVDEDNRAWTSGSAYNDNRAITIECSSDKNNHNALNEKVYNKLVNLCVDICRRYGKTKAVYFPNKVSAENYNLRDNEMLFTKHNFYQNVACPDTWLENKYPEFISRVNAILDGTIKPKSDDETKLYRVQVGAFKSKENAIKLCNELKQKGYNDAFIKEV